MIIDEDVNIIQNIVPFLLFHLTSGYISVADRRHGMLIKRRTSTTNLLAPVSTNVLSISVNIVHLHTRESHTDLPSAAGKL